MAVCSTNGSSTNPFWVIIVVLETSAFKSTISYWAIDKLPVILS